ncbi:MAG TPA: SIMPL domain-containing protein [Chthoniobacterales bacterium]
MKTLLVCAFALIPLSVGAEVAGLAGLPNQPFLYVEGKAQIQKAPDLITLRFDIEGRDADQGKANLEVQAKARKVFALLKEAKVEDRDVVAQDLHSRPAYERDEVDQKNRGKLIGYIVTRSFEVAVRDLTKYGKLGDQIMELGGIDLNSISSELSDGEKLGEELWPKAIANAREKAEKTLKPMGMKIDSVFAVSAIDFAEIPAEFFKGGNRVVVTGMNVPTPPDEPSHYLPEIVTIESTAHVIYLISPVK